MQEPKRFPKREETIFQSNFFQKFAKYILAFSFALSVVYIVPPPKKSEAFFGSIALAVKEYGLDGVANYIGKRLLQMITRDTVNWINGGFQGSPGFVTNPERFALEIADATFNNFLDQTRCYTDPVTKKEVCGTLDDFLCSPFRVNLQIALRARYIGDVQYRCSLEDVAGNFTDFYNDFNKGGWKSWFNVTQIRANTPFGAYLEVENDLYLRIGQGQTTWERKQDWGNGLLSWDTCNDPFPMLYYEQGPDNADGSPSLVQKSRPKTPKECSPRYLESNTPGTVIESQLTKVFGSSIAGLEVADEINEIIGALLDQFTIKLFNSAKGLFGLKNKLDDNPGRVIAQVNYDNVLEPDDPDVAEYCGSQREGFYPTATLKVGGDATFTTNRRDVTVQPGDVVTYSWCGANSNQYASSYTVRQDLSSGCADSGTDVPWIAQNAYGEQSATVGAEQIGCVYEITYAARNTGATDPLTGNLTTETAESRIIVRVGETQPPVVAGQCTISEVTIENLAAATTQLNSEISGVANTIGNSIVITSTNGTVQLTPVSPSGVAQSIQQQVASQIGCTSTSNLTFVVFQVDNPNALPPEILAQLGAERPNQILVVLDSVGSPATTNTVSGVVGGPAGSGTTQTTTGTNGSNFTTGTSALNPENTSTTGAGGQTSSGTTQTSGSATKRTLPQKMGVYHWANNFTGTGNNALVDGVNFAANEGFQTVRLTLSPRYKSDYKIGNQSCTNQPLASIAASPEWQSALANPRITTYILTTYDSTTFGDCSTKKYLTPSFFTSQNTTAIETEYKNLAQYLANTYKGTGKRFIISNWESDNDVYCGSAYNYTNSSSFRSSCNQNINTWFGANNFSDILGALTSWFKAREKGIADGESLVTGGAQVAHAPEFVSVHMLKDAGYSDVLRSVIPQLNPDYISYSAYESLGANETLTEDITYIRNQVTKPLIIGEFGYDRSTDGTQGAATKLSQATEKLFSNPNISLAIIWQLFDQSGGNFGLFSGGGVEQSTGTAVINTLSN